MNPSVTVSRKIRVEIAHSTKVCSAVAGPYSPKLKETCHTTSVTRIASRARLEPKRYRFRIDTLNYSGTGSGGLPNENKQNPPPLSVAPRLICNASTLQNHHRQRLAGGMRDRERDAAHTQFFGNFSRLSVEAQGGLAGT